MDLNFVLVGDLICRQKLYHVLPLVALQRDDLFRLLRFFPSAVSIHFHYCPVAAELFFKLLQDLLQIVLRRKALHCGHALSPIPLLNTDVNRITKLLCVAGLLWVKVISKGVRRTYVVKICHNSRLYPCVRFSQVYFANKSLHSFPSVNSVLLQAKEPFE